MESADKSITICVCALMSAIVLMVTAIYMPDAIRAWNGLPPCVCK